MKRLGVLLLVAVGSACAVAAVAWSQGRSGNAFTGVAIATDAEPAVPGGRVDYLRALEDLGDVDYLRAYGDDRAYELGQSACAMYEAGTPIPDVFDSISQEPEFKLQRFEDTSSSVVVAATHHICPQFSASLRTHLDGP